MVRQVIEHQAKNKENDELQVIVIYETGISKQEIKRMNRYSKTYKTLYFSKALNKYEFKNA